MKNTIHTLILFDIDGTLLHPGGVGRAATGAAMLEVFGTSGAIDTHHFSGKTDWHTLNELLGAYGFTSGQIKDRLDTYILAIERHIDRLIPEHAVRALPGALAAIDRLYRDPAILLGVVTGNMPTSARAKMRAAGFNPGLFAIGAYGHEATDRNTLTPLALARAEHHCGHTIAPENVYVVGDTVMDIASARAIHSVAVAVRTGFEEEADLIAAKPDYLIDDLTALCDIVECAVIKD